MRVQFEVLIFRVTSVLCCLISQNGQVVENWRSASRTEIRTTDLAATEITVDLQDDNHEVEWPTDWPVQDSKSIFKFADYKSAVLEEIKNKEKINGIKWNRFSILNEFLKGHRAGELTLFSGLTGLGKTTFLAEYSLDLCIQGDPKSVLKFSDYKSAVLEEIKNKEKINGIKWNRFSGELTLFSGLTGLGKTTFLAEYSLDLCIQGVKTLWVNFEIPNERLLTTMVTQFAKKSLIGNVAEFLSISDEFDKLNMFLLDIYEGKMTVEGILELIEHSIKEEEIKHTVVDNLQSFLTAKTSSLIGFDSLRIQEMIFASIKDIGRKLKCHMTIVIHPRKEQKSELNNNSIAGTGLAIQQADNIMFLQTARESPYLEITKNRYAGLKGSIGLEFDPATFCYEMTPIDSRL
ncbi:Twinkle protein, mitochondrial [Araneus ventricosus]|uniref:Twinkle protein, mitochondrial n=1 Tax=Araneus ventricosus TaxID=182803 RepID=A0A4Y2G3R1_ARAVE|nr:Twinkle protein, mitochondrial [Araneus ventricosus]